ncbi:hypothetical protein Q1695_012609 [Nippostrongylus brasiliensis]|nr:hypothetical protein Q1695_012609 [Nippostrongylus brasiliensis]
MENTVKECGDNMTLFVLLQHPLDRFLSGYIDKCHYEIYLWNESERCFGCKHDMRCFVERIHTLFARYANGNGTKQISRMEYQHLRHFAPQTWFCEFAQYKDSCILIHYQSDRDGLIKLADALHKVLERAQVPAATLKHIHEELLEGSTRHIAQNSGLKRTVTQQLLSDDYVMRMLIHIYFYDFVEFGFG